MKSPQEVKAYVEQAASRLGLSTFDTMTVLDKLSQAAASPASLLPMRQEAFASSTPASGLLLLALTNLEMAINGDRDAWREASEGPRDETAAWLAKIAEVEKTDPEHAKRMREGLVAAEKENAEDAERRRQLQQTVKDEERLAAAKEAAEREARRAAALAAVDREFPAGGPKQ